MSLYNRVEKYLMKIISAQLTEGCSVLLRNRNRKVDEAPADNSLWELDLTLCRSSCVALPVPAALCLETPGNSNLTPHTSELWNPDPVTQNHKIVNNFLLTKCEVLQGNLCICTSVLHLCILLCGNVKHEKGSLGQVERRWVMGTKQCGRNINKWKRLRATVLMDGELLTDHEDL